MSKALVIKGANFAKNAVEKITVTEPVPCTGIALSQNSIEFAAIGSTTTLIATVTPLDTTEQVVWISSNEVAATVANGVVTCNGVGAATITAMCGTQIATCEVTSAVTINDADLYSINGRYIQTTDMTISPVKDYCALSTEGSGTTNAGRSRTYVYATRQDGWNKPFNGNSAATNGPIPILNGTSRIKVKADGFYAPSDKGDFLVLEDATTLSTYNIANKGARAVSNILMAEQIDGYFVWDISDRDPSANSFVFTVRSYNKEAATITEQVSITFE